MVNFQEINFYKTEESTESNYVKWQLNGKEWDCGEEFLKQNQEHWKQWKGIEKNEIGRCLQVSIWSIMELPKEKRTVEVGCKIVNKSDV